jgi:hypothetical protein
MKWVTRRRPKTDRIACPWLVRRFIDPEAEIVFVPSDDVLRVAQEVGGHSFDAPGAEYTHQVADNGDQRCSFETLLFEFGLTDNKALVRLSKIVHAADISGDLTTDPAGPGLLAIGIGGLDVEADDVRLLERATFVYDAFYAWCERQTS